MDFSKIIANSIKYPLRNISKLPIIFILFLLIVITPIGKLLNNDYMVFAGVISFFIFILIVPGYFLDMVKMGSKGSSVFPSLNIVNTIYDSVRVMLLRIVYMIVPASVFFIVLSTLGSTSIEMLYRLEILSFIATFGFLIILILATYLIFEFFLFFAKARLAYLNSLSEALKIHKVVKDIQNIGLSNIIKWIVAMIILMFVFSFVSSFVLTVPYVGILIDICIIVPIMNSIANYSLGLLYSNIGAF